MTVDIHQANAPAASIGKNKMQHSKLHPAMRDAGHTTTEDKQSARTYVKPTPANAEGYAPTHPGIFKVVLQGNAGDEEYSSFLVAERDFPPNSTITKLSNITFPGIKAYSSVQYGNGPSDHLELNSDLLFVNHSCNPNVAFDLSKTRTSTSPSQPQWVLRTLSRPVKKGETLTFFYPSTEWEMDQCFECGCGEGEKCLGKISGAKDLPLKTLEVQEFINPHIWELKRDQERE